MSDLIGFRSKIEWAEQHIRHLEREVRYFKESNPYVVESEIDPQAGQRVYRVTRVDPVWPHIGLIAGDVLNNLRCTLDHMAMRLWQAGARVGREKDVGFPITADPTKYEAERARKIQGVRQQVVDTIDATEPYKGGAGHQLWVLNELNNIGKHRRLNVIGVHFGGFWTHPLVLEMLRRAAKENPGIVGSSPPGYWFRPESRQGTLKVGDELYRCPPHEKVEDQTEFTFDVAIDEPGVAQGEPVVEFLHQLAHLVRRIEDQLSYLL